MGLEKKPACSWTRESPKSFNSSFDANLRARRAGGKLGIWNLDGGATYSSGFLRRHYVKWSVDWFSQHCCQETPEVQVQAQVYNVRDICIMLLHLSSKVSPVLTGGETLETQVISSHLNYPVILPIEKSFAFVQELDY